MNIKIIAEEIVKEADFESHLERAMESLHFLRNEWDLERRRNQNVLTVSGYNKNDYQKLIKNLEPDFNTSYDQNFKGLVFKEVKPLFRKTKF